MRKFGREIKKGNPEKKIQMRYTKITTLPLNRVIILCRDVVIKSQIEAIFNSMMMMIQG